MNLGYRKHFKLKQKLFSFIIISAGIFSLDCSGTRIPSASKEQNIDYLIDKGKKYWEQRSDSISLDNAEHFISLAHEQRPDNFELSVLYSRILYTQGLFIEIDEKVQDELFVKGLKVCRKAVLNHPDFIPIYNHSQGDSTFKLISALAESPKSVVPGLFWWATNLVRHLNTKPALERMNYRELIEVIMHRIISLDPGYYYSGPYRFFGSMYTRIPGVELSQSETYFKQAMVSHPEFLGNAVHMAEFYHQKAGNREQFHKILKTVLETDLMKNPELLSENLFYKKRAKMLLEKEPSLFE